MHTLNYRTLNATILIALLALVPALWLAPWLREHTGLLYPGCALEQLTGQSCPMCGLTTSLRDLLMCNRERGAMHPLALPVAAVVLLEIAARTALVMRKPSLKSVQRVKRWDVKLHGALLAAYLVYSAAFFAGCI